MNLILPKYFTLDIIYKKLLVTPRKMQNDSPGFHTMAHFSTQGNLLTHFGQQN